MLSNCPAMGKGGEAFSIIRCPKSRSWWYGAT